MAVINTEKKCNDLDERTTGLTNFTDRRTSLFSSSRKLGRWLQQDRLLHMLIVTKEVSNCKQIFLFLLLHDYMNLLIIKLIYKENCERYSKMSSGVYVLLSAVCGKMKTRKNLWKCTKYIILFKYILCVYVGLY